MKLALPKYNEDFSFQSDPKTVSMNHSCIELEVNRNAIQQCISVLQEEKDLLVAP